MLHNYDYTKHHWIVHLKEWIVCEFILVKLFTHVPPKRWQARFGP